MNGPHITAELLGLSLYHDTETGNMQITRGLQVNSQRQTITSTYTLNTSSAVVHSLSATSTQQVALCATTDNTLYIIKNSSVGSVNLDVKQGSTLVTQISAQQTSLVMRINGVWEQILKA